MVGRFRIFVTIVLAVAGALLPPTLAGAAPLRTFYVDPAGNDSAAGSSAAPWRTLQKAADTVRAGDLVIVRAGHYAGLYLTTSGTATDPITFRGEPGAIVDSQNPRTQDGINLEGASYVVVESFTVTGVPRAGIRSVVNHHVTIRNNTGDLNGRWGILTGFSDDLLIENNVMSRSQAEHGIYVSNSGDRPVIRRNHVWGNNANGIHMNGDLSQGGDGVISGAVVEDNIIHDNGVAGGSGINGDGVQSSIIRNNLLYNNHASGISLYQIDAGQPARNNQILNNTIVMASDARWAINIQNASTGNVVRNNILFNQHPFRGSIAISADSLPGFVSDTNVIMDRFSMDGGDTRVTLAAWRSASGQDAHSILATPATLFASFTGNDYHLSATSPARDAGGSVANVTDDLEGAPRPQGSAFDIGAYEFPASTAPVTLTVTRTGNGTVTSAPAGISCGTGCSAAFTAGTSVTLTATSATGSIFTGWSGGGCSGTGACGLTLSNTTTVSAAFGPAPVAVTVVRAGVGSGTVTSAPAGITCGTTCSATFSSGSSMVLTATPAGGSVFSGWSGGGCAGTGTCTVTPTSATTVTATFTSSTTFGLTVSVAGAGTGTVTSTPAGLACSAVCSATFSSGTSVTLTAAPGAGSAFAGWSGGCSGAGPCTVLIDQARAVTARFSRVFADQTLTPRSSVVRAAHFTELRGAIDTLRSRQGLAGFGWTDPSLAAGATTIKRVHLVELRAAVAAVYSARGLSAPAWTDPTITAAATLVRAAHITELRAAVLALE
jgi:parallel beta helix pectate lyase-like protein/List-Bact-rpt repeat protein